MARTAPQDLTQPGARVWDGIPINFNPYNKDLGDAFLVGPAAAPGNVGQVGIVAVYTGATGGPTSQDTVTLTVAYTLEDGTDTVPAGAAITAGGDFTWTPTETQGGTSHSFKIRVTDDGTGTLFDEEEILFTINDTNVAPTLDPVGAQSVDETVLLAFTATASDSDIPADTLTFSLEDGTDTVPAGAGSRRGSNAARVLLPAAVRPTMANERPAGTSKLTSRSTGSSP